jgi:glutathione S-transferase
LIPAKLIAGQDALALMDRHLAGQHFFLADRPTLADISLFAYTHLAEEGGFGLENYLAVCEWIDRVKKLPGYVPMT